MKILNIIHIPKIFKAMAVATPLLLTSSALQAQQYETKPDTFEKTISTGTVEIADSMQHSPNIKIAHKVIQPTIVVDLSERQLYHYGSDAILEGIYPIASGKKTTPTKSGLKIIADIEDYPYKQAYGTKRKRNPNDYGNHVLRLKNVDARTGKIIGEDGQYIHGTFNPSSIGKRVSKGCIRVHNDVIDKLADELQSGQYVLIRE